MSKEGKKLPQRHRAEWNAEDLVYLNKNYGKISNVQIAQYLQRTEYAIESKARKTGVKVGSPREKPPIKEMVMQKLENRDYSRGELSNLLRIPFSSLYKPLLSLLNSGEVASYDRKDVPGLGRAKIIYTVRTDLQSSVNEKVEV